MFKLYLLIIFLINCFLEILVRHFNELFLFFYDIKYPLLRFKKMKLSALKRQIVDNKKKESKNQN